MKLAQWLASKALVKSAMDLREKNDTFSRIIEMLEEESPLQSPLSPQGPTADDRSYRLGLLEGYHQCLKNLKATWTPPPVQPKPLKASFKPPEE